MYASWWVGSRCLSVCDTNIVDDLAREINGRNLIKNYIQIISDLN